MHEEAKSSLYCNFFITQILFRKILYECIFTAYNILAF